MKKIAFIVGTRPEIVKLAPVIEATAKLIGYAPYVISTGQQGQLLNKTLLEFNIEPNIEIDVKFETTLLTEQFGNLVKHVGYCIQKSDSRYVVIQGDTSSAFAGAVAGYLLNIPVGHVEAGLRSNDLSSPFPEEGYRTMISRIARHHFAPTAEAVKNLLAERISKEDIHLVGNTIVDSILAYSSPKSLTSNVKKVLVTLHRRESFGQPIRDIVNAIRDFSLEELDTDINVIIHPNPNSGLVMKEILSDLVNVNLMNPLSYKDLLHEIRTSNLVLTDSGGIQEECAVIGTNLLIARNETERPEVLSETRRLIGTSRNEVYSNLKAEVKEGLRVSNYSAFNLSILGDGQSSSRICKVIRDSI